MKTKEAIERVTARFDKWALDEEDLAALQALGLVPMENEDEKIRKRIIAYFKACTLHKDVVDEFVSWLEKQKEQKPIDIDFVSDWLRKHIKTYVNSEYNEFHKTVEYDGSINIERLIEDLKKAIEQQSFAHKNDFVSKPAEWSDEDEGMLNCIIATLCEESHGGREANDKMVVWLENRLRILRPQPKQEWNKEDEEMIQDIIDLLDPNIAAPDFHEIEKWLKFLPKRFNLQPKQEWSEEDDIITNVISYLNGEYGFKTHDDENAYRKGLVRQLKSLKPHWKPSEEQIEWLESAVRLSTNKPHIHGIIISLYEQLKRL